MQELSGIRTDVISTRCLHRLVACDVSSGRTRSNVLSNVLGDKMIIVKWRSKLHYSKFHTSYGNSNLNGIAIAITDLLQYLPDLTRSWIPADRCCT